MDYGVWLLNMRKKVFKWVRWYRGDKGKEGEIVKIPT